MMGVDELLLNAMLSVVEPKSCCYLAGPITTSRQLLLGEDPAVLEARNREDLAKQARCLRETLGCPVVNPGLLIVPGWSGSAYGNFFIGAMESLCFEVRFMPGWEYSIGASKEYVHALTTGLPCLNIDGSPLTRSRAISLLGDARSAYRSVDPRRSDKLTERIYALEVK